MLGLFEFVHLTYNKEALIEFLIQHRVLLSTFKCSQCGSDININKEKLLYRCNKRFYVKNVHKKRVPKQCNFTKSAKIGTCFSKSHLDVNTICQIVACFLMFHHPCQDDTREETGVAPATIIEWFNFCREVCVFWAEKHSEKLGGPGCIVEIDEAKVGKRKYNQTLEKEHWIFGGYERESKKIFIVSVEEKNRTEKILLAYIKEWILPGTTIILNCWKSYNWLNNENFQHLTMSHSYNFVNPDTADAQHIKHVWREVRRNIPRTRSDRVLIYLSEYLFKRAYSRMNRIEIFFDVIAEMYPPMSICEDQPEISDQEPSTSIA